MTINIFMYIYIGENGHWDIYAPPLQIITQKFFPIFFIFFFHFRCILLQISHKKCFFISISILGRSGVKQPDSNKTKLLNIGRHPSCKDLQFICGWDIMNLKLNSLI